MPDEIHTNMKPVGIIGGTGFYRMKLEAEQTVQVDTPFGKSEVVRGVVDRQQVVFVARHGKGHELLPHEVNYRASVYALKKLGVVEVFAFCMAGALKKRYHPGDIVVPDQFIDLTHGRPNTFFGKGNSAYVPMADPFCTALSNFVTEELSKQGLTVHNGGTYVCVNGPHFSTRAESKLYSQFGDVVGMTMATEAKLAREAGLCYSPIASIVDYDTCSMGMKDMKTVIVNVQRAAVQLARTMPETRECLCHNALSHSLVNLSEESNNPLDVILGCDADNNTPMMKKHH